MKGRPGLWQRPGLLRRPEALPCRQHWVPSPAPVALSPVPEAPSPVPEARRPPGWNRFIRQSRAID